MGRLFSFVSTLTVNQFGNDCIIKTEEDSSVGWRQEHKAAAEKLKSASQLKIWKITSESEITSCTVLRESPTIRLCFLVGVEVLFWGKKKKRLVEENERCSDPSTCSYYSCKILQSPILAFICSNK